jgi:preprotein translocase subunit SecE
MGRADARPERKPRKDMADKFKLMLAILFVVAGLAGFYVLGDKPMVLRVLVVLGGVAAAGVIAGLTPTGRRFGVFAKDSVNEAKRVVWPTRKEAIQTTGIVFVFVVLMALFIFGVDTVLASIVKTLTNRGA